VYNLFYRYIIVFDDLAGIVDLKNTYLNLKRLTMSNFVHTNIFKQYNCPDFENEPTFELPEEPDIGALMGFLENQISDFELPEEPQLNALIGYSDCESCYHRLETIKRIQAGIKQLRGGV
jgi:hypothetical protein